MNNHNILKVLLILLAVSVAFLAISIGIYLGMKTSRSASSESKEAAITTSQGSPESAAESSVEEPTTSSEEATPESTVEESRCEERPNAPEVRKATEEAARKYPNDFGWVYEGQSNYSECAPLSYALLSQREITNSQFTTLIVFFHNGDYLGVDSVYPQQVQSIEPHGDALDVVYRDWEALESSGQPNAAAPAYETTVRYYWDGESVQYEGRIPNTHLPARR